MAAEEDDEINGPRKEIALTCTSRRSLCFKLKIPNSEAESSVVFQDPTTSQNQNQESQEETQVEEEEEEEVLAFVCPVCDKRFKSGKALGGHKRMHNMNKKTTSPVLDVDEEEVEEEDGDPVVCTECSKRFRSMKSLCGHMRAHPERPYRGIQPPPPIKSCDSAPLGWSVTGRRSRSCSESSSSLVFVVPGMDEDIKEAVLDLMLLAHYKPKKNNIVFSFDDNEQSSSEEYCSDTKLKRKRPNVDALKIKKEEEEDQLAYENNNKKKILNETKKVGAAAAADEEKKKKKRYVCSACDKSFASYQALGGHRSSHNKPFSHSHSHSHLNNKNNNNNNNNNQNLLNFDLNEPPPPDQDEFI